MAKETIQLTKEEKTLFESLSVVQKQNMEFALMRYCTTEWQKVAMIVVKTIESYYPELSEMSGVFVQQIAELVEKGELLSKGNLNKIRFSEVKLKSKDINKNLIRLSEDERYKNYVKHIAYDNYSEARKCLESITDDLRVSLGGIYMFIGDTYYREKNYTKTKEYYLLAIKVSSGFFFEIEYADLLAYKLGEFEEAETIANKIIKECLENPFEKIEGDFSSQYYQSRSKDIIKDINRMKNKHR
ncbi:hypothetical protein QJU96_08115 [Pasteurella skyensis]|uniref:Tetratricopeptide repeat-containing protein n=1 Tax=Phocoenobacter skyensis TaxID=97481 RepID=A0AAJ6ND96_9PAST|nr:hypothetical protein [Pasteurella skyensis]MDP8171249.1 hypothetical protein [Pasteurella skyensis]MDP8174697.1 hypothetical protein [Pasteurella skyensis]